MLVEALFQLVVFITTIHSQSQDRISHQAFEASRSPYESGDTISWYSTVVRGLFTSGLDINNLPPLRYDYDTNKTSISHVDHNKVILYVDGSIH